MQDLFIDFRQAESIKDLALMLSISEELLQSKLDSDNPTIENELQRTNLAAIFGMPEQYNLTEDIPTYRNVFNKLEIPKKNKHRSKEKRSVWEITRFDYEELYKILSWKLEYFFKHLSIGYPHKASYGYTRGKNILENAQKHCCAKQILHADIKDFFPSISKERICALFQQIGVSDFISEAFANLLTIEGVLAQGLHTSPLISNIICLGMDEDLTILANKHGCTYTRYADDITISGDNVPSKKELEEIFHKHGFILNAEKFRITKPGWHHFVTGLSVETNIPRIPKKMRKKLRQELYYCKKYGVEDHIENAKNIKKTDNYIQRNINRIDGTVRYISYFDKICNNSEFEDTWDAIKREQNVSPHYINQVENYFVDLFVDESELEIHGNNYLVLGIAAVPASNLKDIHDKLYVLLNKYIKDPYVSIKKESLIKNGLHYSDASEDLREDYSELLKYQNIKFYIGYKKLDDPKSYKSVYLSIMTNMLQDRFLNTKCGVRRVIIEKNEKISEKSIISLFNLSHITFADKNCITLSLADFSLSYFRNYVLLDEKRKELFFEKLRGKYKVIKNIDNLNTFTRRHPFYPDLF